MLFVLPQNKGDRLDYSVSAVFVLLISHSEIHQLNLKRKFVFSFVFCLMSSVLLKILRLSRYRYSINEENMMISIIVKQIFLFNYRLYIPTSFCMLFDMAIRRTCSAFLKTWIKTIQNIISCESRAFVKEERQLLLALALKRRTWDSICIIIINNSTYFKLCV